ncbi:MAG: chemotaxis protein, partial [Methylococcales bacterium]
MLSNIHISFKNRILLGFSSLILMMVVLVNVSLLQFSQSQHDTEDLTNTFIPHALAAEGMVVDIIQVQQFLTDVSATHDPEGYKDAEAAALDLKKRISQFKGYLYVTPEQQADLVKIENDFDKFYEQGKHMAATYLSGGLEAGNAIMEEFDSTSLALSQRIQTFKDAAVKRQLETAQRLSASAGHSSNVMMLVSAIVVVLSIFIAIYLTRYLSKQLGIDPFYAKGIAQEIAKGRFNREIQVEEGDTYSLLYAMKQMQLSLTNFVAAQGVMAQKHAEGWISEKMDAESFPGDYGKMAKEINDLVGSHIAVKMQVVKIISEYARGNFSVDIDRLPGEKAKITDAIDNVKKTLFDVSKEIKVLAEA